MKPITQIDPKLVNKLQSNRTKIEEHVGELEKNLPEVMDKFAKMKVDARNSFMFENKVRILSEYLDTILKYRKFIQLALLDEIKIDNSIKGNEKEIKDDLQSLLNKIMENSKNNTKSEIEGSPEIKWEEEDKDE